MTELLQLDPATFKDEFGREPFLVHHRLADHPLLELDAIADLADYLPAELVEHNLGDVPKVLDDPDAELGRLEQTPGEVARGIETNGCWMVIKEIERHPSYAALLNESLDEVEHFVTGLEGPMRRRKGFIFLSAPDSVTPVHIDTEHNLLLQIRGVKTMHTGPFSDPDVVERELERLHGDRASRYLEQSPENMEAFELNPGDGICMPHSAPHWVQNGPAPSTSLSITFQTPSSQRIGHVYALNSRLRRFNVTPRPPNGGRLRDGAKALAWRSTAPVRVLRRRLSA